MTNERFPLIPEFMKKKLFNVIVVLVIAALSLFTFFLSDSLDQYSIGFSLSKLTGNFNIAITSWGILIAFIGVALMVFLCFMVRQMILEKHEPNNMKLFNIIYFATFGLIAAIFVLLLALVFPWNKYGGFTSESVGNMFATIGLYLVFYIAFVFIAAVVGAIVALINKLANKK